MTSNEAQTHALEGPQDAREVFEILVREHADMLVAYLRTVLGRNSSVDDLFQEAMLVAWRRLKDYDRSRPFAPWLRGIAQMLVLEHARKTRTRPAATDPDVLAAIDERFGILETVPADTFLERAERLLDCMPKLPQAMREAIELIYARNMSLAAAAATTGDNKDTLGKRVQRARQLLAECIGIGEQAP